MEIPYMVSQQPYSSGYCGSCASSVDYVMEGQYVALEQPGHGGHSTSSNSHAKRTRAKRAKKHQQHEFTTSPEIKDKCEELQKKLNGISVNPKEVLWCLKDWVCRLALNYEGSHIVQQVVKLNEEAAQTVSIELLASIDKAVKSLNGNHVVQTLIWHLPVDLTIPIIDAIQNKITQIARHKLGCRIICRLLEQSGWHPRTQQLIDELFGNDNLKKLITHPNGHFVVCVALEHGTEEQQRQILTELGKDLHKLVQTKHAVYVLQEAVACCHCEESETRELRDRLTRRLIFNYDLVDLADDDHGYIIVRALLSLSTYTGSVKVLLEPRLKELQATRYGKRVLNMSDSEISDIETISSSCEELDGT